MEDKIIKRKFILFACLLLISANTHSANAAKGSITGTVAIWKTRVKTKGAKSYKNVIVYLEKVGNNKFSPPAESVNIRQEGLVFIPHVVAILRGSKVNFQNDDHDNHNVYLFDDTSGKILDLGTHGYGVNTEHQFNKPGAVTVLCKIHLEMAAHIVVLENPYFTQVEIDENTQTASFTLQNVPPGNYIINTWHKKLKLKGGGQQVTVTQNKTTKVKLIITKKKYAK